MSLFRQSLLPVSLMCFLSLLGCAGLQGGLGGVLDSGAGGDGRLDASTVAAGIKEALRVGTQNTVASTSRLDGFLGNELIRIAIPDQLESTASTLRKFGFGSQVDELEIGMNRAAELAAAEARDVFWAAIKSMTVADAFGILNGGDTAATEYFREKSGQALRERFHPIVQSKIDGIGLSRVYSRFADTYNNIPLSGAPVLVDLDEYVTDRALYGLFAVLGREEMRIREDPLARTTDLLRRVFGN